LKTDSKQKLSKRPHSKERENFDKHPHCSIRALAGKKWEANFLTKNVSKYFEFAVQEYQERGNIIKLNQIKMRGLLYLLSLSDCK
jgi:hypothetical protein